MLSCHRPWSPRKVKPATASSATRQLATAQETYSGQADHPEPADLRQRTVAGGLRDEVLDEGHQVVDDQPDLVEEVQEERVGVAVGADGVVDVVEPAVQVGEVGRGQGQGLLPAQYGEQDEPDDHDPGDHHGPADPALGGDRRAAPGSAVRPPMSRVSPWRRSSGVAFLTGDHGEDLLVADDAEQFAVLDHLDGLLGGEHRPGGFLDDDVRAQLGPVQRRLSGVAGRMIQRRVRTSPRATSFTKSRT